MSDSYKLEPGVTENLSPAQVTAIMALLQHGDKSRAARAADVSRTTLYRWLTTDQNFQNALEAATQQALRSFSANLVRLSEKAVKALESALSQRQTIHVRLRAADIVTSRLLAVRELVDLEDRLSALEGAINEQTKH